ncbi:hypothetical protein [Actinophytocola sp.]|uniref:hypothetical protein n=1 Tax=Actinophytocola sp. TaxID=1872138 RepID=UPI002D7EF19A|nr:hypothetical protein [Actinophytocola sp.]HET9143237.1 hypothetical protein [Actinophytocola sp.]
MDRPLGAVERAAVAEFPELRTLIDLRDRGGWLFFRAGTGELRGVRAWPQGFADALLVRGSHDAAALRGDHAGGVVWARDGCLVHVVNGLLDLPAPGAPGAPVLVRGSAPRLWTP